LTSENATTTENTNAPRDTTENTTSPEPNWISYSEAERLFSISRFTILRLSEAGYVRTTRVTRKKTLVDRESVEAFLDSRANQPK
jgi:hypothetical protein